MLNSTVSGGYEAQGILEVQVLPDLIDFSQVSYAKVFLSYTDPDKGVRAEREIVIVADAEDPITWRLDLQHDSKTSFMWRTTFFMNDGSTRETPLVTTEDLTIIPQIV